MHRVLAMVAPDLALLGRYIAKSRVLNRSLFLTHSWASMHFVLSPSYGTTVRRCQPACFSSKHAMHSLVNAACFVKLSPRKQVAGPGGGCIFPIRLVNRCHRGHASTLSFLIPHPRKPLHSGAVWLALWERRSLFRLWSWLTRSKANEEPAQLSTRMPTSEIGNAK